MMVESRKYGFIHKIKVVFLSKLKTQKYEKSSVYIRNYY